MLTVTRAEPVAAQALFATRLESAHYSTIVHLLGIPLSRSRPVWQATSRPILHLMTKITALRVNVRMSD